MEHVVIKDGVLTLVGAPFVFKAEEKHRSDKDKTNKKFFNYESAYRLKSTNTWRVNYDLCDAKGNKLCGVVDGACYVADMSEIRMNAYSLVLKMEQDRFEFSLPCIKDVVNDLNEMGFPCEFQIDDINSTYNFKVVCVDEDNKPRTSKEFWLPLVVFRYLFHGDGASNIIDRYLSFMDAYPDADKFKVLQAVHGFFTAYGNINTNHTLLRLGTKKIMGRESFAEIAKQTGNVYSNHPCHQDGFDKGTVLNYFDDKSLYEALLKHKD